MVLTKGSTLVILALDRYAIRLWDENRTAARRWLPNAFISKIIHSHVMASRKAVDEAKQKGLRRTWQTSKG